MYTDILFHPLTIKGKWTKTAIVLLTDGNLQAYYYMSDWLVSGFLFLKVT